MVHTFREKLCWLAICDLPIVSVVFLQSTVGYLTISRVPAARVYRSLLRSECYLIIATTNSYRVSTLKLGCKNPYYVHLMTGLDPQGRNSQGSSI